MLRCVARSPATRSDTCRRPGAARYAESCKPSSRGGIAFEESPDITGQGGREPDPGKPAGKCHRNTPPMARQHVRRAQARVKRCGKSAPAPWRHGGQANPTRCKAKQDRLKAARRGPGRPLRWMAAQRQNPAYRLATEKPRKRGAFLCPTRGTSCSVELEPTTAPSAPMAIRRGEIQAAIGHWEIPASRGQHPTTARWLPKPPRRAAREDERRAMPHASGRLAPGPRY